jgi:SAM-dependent methyltransferase
MLLAKASQMAWLNICSMSSRLVITIRDHGLLAAGRRGWWRAHERVREWKLGIRTMGSIDAMALNSGAGNFGYQPISYKAFDLALNSIQYDANDVFVDLGCGMGRAVILAGLRAMRRVIGVEISAKLCALARRNVENAQAHLRAAVVEIVEADAREYHLPDNSTILLLFNPFDEPILRQVLENVHQSLAQAPRTLTVVYAIPRSRRDLLAEVPWLQLKEVLPITDEAWLHLGVYRSMQDVP